MSTTTPPAAIPSSACSVGWWRATLMPGEALYRHAHHGLVGFARRRLHNPEAAEDAASETMTRALAGIDGFVPRGGGLPAWLFGILRNVVLEHHRRSAKVVLLEVADRDDEDPLPGDRLLAAEQRRDMRAAFATLTEQDQELLELRVVGGLTGPAAGEILGMSSGAVRMAQMRAIERLRRSYSAVAGGDL